MPGNKTDFDDVVANARPAPVSFRMTQEMLDWVDVTAKQREMTRTEMLIACIEFTRRAIKEGEDQEND